MSLLKYSEASCIDAAERTKGCCHTANRAALFLEIKDDRNN